MRRKRNWLTPDEARRIPAVTPGVTQPNRSRTRGISRTIATPVREGRINPDGSVTMNELDNKAMAEREIQIARENAANKLDEMRERKRRYAQLLANLQKIQTPERWNNKGAAEHE